MYNSHGILSRGEVQIAMRESATTGVEEQGRRTLGLLDKE
jgi:hypothetical protein